LSKTQRNGPGQPRGLIGKMLAEMNPPVFFTAAIVIVCFVAFGAIWPETAGESFKGAQGWIVNHLGWLYILSVAGFLIFTFWLMFSSTGSVKLGQDSEDPEYNNFSWFAMLFSAGMGIGLMFWGVAEPIFHFIGERSGDPRSVEAARLAMRTTFFHWGLHAWAIYIIVGLSLAYFAYRHNLPLTIRSTLYPLLGDRINGWFGHLVEIMAVFGTIFGVATSLGLGVVQISAGLEYLGWLPNNPTTQFILIAVITFLATLSVVSGLDVGIRRLSEMNLGVSLILALFVFVLGPTIFLLSMFVESIGDYVAGLIDMTLTTDAYQGPQKWQGYWTMFYWGWWISWSPFVGMFIARISRGRTIRSFVTGALLVPTVLTFMWMVIFGGSAMHMELFPGDYGGAEQVISVADAVEEDAPLGLFAMLQNLPLPGITIFLSIVVIATYFVTSSDSASLVVDILTSGGDPNPPVWSRVFWATMEGAVAAVLLYAGYNVLSGEDGSAMEALEALQNAAIITALPFCLIMILICYCLVRGLMAERRGIDSALPVETVELSGFETPENTEHPPSTRWQERLEAILGRPRGGGPREATGELAKARDRAKQFIEQTVLPAFREISQELKKHGREVRVERLHYQANLVVLREGAEEFRYTIRARVFRQAVAAFPELKDDDVPRRVMGEVITRGRFAKDHDVDRFTHEGIIEDFLHEYAKWMGW